MLLSAIAGAGSSLIGNIGNWFSQRSTNKMNYRMFREGQQFSHDEATLAYQRQRALINEQNEYNSYSNQRSLMEEAGYNPNMLVGSTAGTATSTSSTNAPQAAQPSPIAMQAARLDLAGQFAQVQSALADAKLKDIQVGKVVEDTTGQKLQNDYQTIANDLYKRYGEIERTLGVDSQNITNALAQSQTDLNRISGQLAQYDLSVMKPQEFLKLSADTVVSETMSAFYDTLRRRNDQGITLDKEQFELEVKRLAIQLSVGMATCSKLYAEANEIQTLLPAKLTLTENLGKNALMDYGLKSQQYSFMRAPDGYDYSQGGPLFRSMVGNMKLTELSSDRQSEFDRRTREREIKALQKSLKASYESAKVSILNSGHQQGAYGNDFLGTLNWSIREVSSYLPFSGIGSLSR